MPVFTGSTTHRGTYSLVESGVANSGVYQDIADLEPGQQYAVSAWVQSTGTAAGELYIDDTTGNPVSRIAR